jgi:anti-sigma factor RsiW
VKPWLAASSTLATGHGSATRGSRSLAGADYLDNRPVAALVYRYRQHVINLFVWPDEKSGRVLPQALSKHGYNVLRWSDAGMTYWAISDVNAAELKTFAETYASAR